MTIPELQPEEWRDIPGFSGYRASSLGRISGKRVPIMRAKVTAAGYFAVKLYSNGYQYLSVHRLVLLAFSGEPADDTQLCRHLNGVRADNRPENLKWGTHAENMQDMIRHGHTRAAWTHCLSGHEFNAHSTYVEPASGIRRCRICKGYSGPRQPRATHCPLGHTYTWYSGGTKRCSECSRKRSPPKKTGPAVKTHCKWGHKRRLDASGKMQCGTCSREWYRNNKSLAARAKLGEDAKP